MEKITEVKMTYESLEQYGKFPSNEYLMFSEFIDNSISSYIGRLNSSNGMSVAKGLKIFIDINKTKNNKTSLRIADNANGMDEARFNKSLEIGNSKRENKDSELNVYGVGLKQAAFFLGQRLEIQTKTKITKKTLSTYIDILEIANSDSNVVRYKVLSDDKKILLWEDDIKSEVSSGTIIKIGYLRKGRLGQSTIEQMQLNLGMKYFNFLQEGMELKIKSQFNDKEPIVYNIEPQRPMAENAAYFMGSVKENHKWIGRKSNDWAIELNEKIKTELIDWKENKFYKLFIDKISTDSDFVWEINEEILSGIKITGQIGILAAELVVKLNNKRQTYVKYNGWSIFQANRAILCGPNDEKNSGMSNYNDGMISRDISGSSNHKRRWYGWFNIDSLYNAFDEIGQRKYLDLNTNKSGLVWLDESARMQFNKIILDFIEGFDIILSTYSKLQQMYVKKDNNVKDKDLSKSITETTNPKVLKYYEHINQKYVYKVFLENNEDQFLKISIKALDDDVKNVPLFNYSEPSAQEYEIEVNTHNPLWAPLVNEIINEDALIQIHKLAIIITLTQIFQAEDYDKNSNTIFTVLKENIGEFNLTKALSFFANKICVVDNDEV